VNTQASKVFVVSYGTGASPTTDVVPKPSRWSLEREISLVRPALLYSDRVTLISLGYSVSSMFARCIGSAEAEPHKFLDFFQSLYPAIGSRPEWADVYRAKRIFERSTSPRKRREARQLMVSEISETFDAQKRISGGKPFFSDLIDYDGIEELSRVQLTGRLDMEGIPGFSATNIGSMMQELTAGMLAAAAGDSPGDESVKEMVERVSSLTKRLIDVIQDPAAYPMLDDHARRMLRRGAAEGFTEIDRQRSRVGGVAAHVSGRLPMINASLYDICETRQTLSDHIGAFHEAIADCRKIYALRNGITVLLGKYLTYTRAALNPSYEIWERGLLRFTPQQA
jgi:hypothetical protein